MNNTLPLEQISKSDKIGSNLILRQYTLDLMAGLMRLNLLTQN